MGFPRILADALCTCPVQIGGTSWRRQRSRRALRSPLQLQSSAMRGGQRRGSCAWRSRRVLRILQCRAAALMSASAGCPTIMCGLIQHVHPGTGSESHCSVGSLLPLPPGCCAVPTDNDLPVVADDDREPTCSVGKRQDSRNHMLVAART